MKKQYIYDKTEGTFGTFHFDSKVYPLLKNDISTMPDMHFDDDTMSVIIRPNTIDGFCALFDFIEKHGFTEAVDFEANTTTNFWHNIIDMIMKRR